MKHRGGGEEAIVISCPADERWPAVQGARYPPAAVTCNLFHVHTAQPTVSLTVVVTLLLLWRLRCDWLLVC